MKSVLFRKTAQVGVVWMVYGIGAFFPLSLLLAQEEALPPSTFDWPDRRPIGTIFLANSAQNWAENPRGYFNDPKMDIRTEEGKKLLARRMDELAERTIEFAKRVGSQGVIVWDIEGGEMPHAITYLGDPRILPQVAPEMDGLADSFFRKILDSGLRTGICIRPSSIVFKDPTQPDLYPWIKTRYGHKDGSTPVDVMDEKITYAKKRWGCTIFYIDTNYTPLMKDGEMVRKKGGTPDFRMLSTGEIAELHRRHPDVILWPEFQQPGYFASGTGYAEYRRVGVFSAAQRQNYPKAFRVWMPRLSVDDVYMAWDDFVQKGIMQGEIFLYECSPMQSPFGDLLRNAQEDAALRKSVQTAGTIPQDELGQLLQSPDPVSRWHGLTALEKQVNPETLKTLIKALGRETSWPLKQRMVVALGRFLDEAATTVLAQVLGSPDLGLSFFAGQSLGKQGTPAAFAELKNAIATNKEPGALSAVRGLGAFKSPESVSTLGNLLVSERGPELRWAALDALGNLRDPAAVPILVQFLNSISGTPASTSRQKAIEALGKCGNREVVPVLIKALADDEFRSLKGTVAEALIMVTGYAPAQQKQDLKTWTEWMDKNLK